MVVVEEEEKRRARRERKDALSLGPLCFWASQRLTLPSCFPGEADLPLLPPPGFPNPARNRSWRVIGGDTGGRPLLTSLSSRAPPRRGCTLLIAVISLSEQITSVQCVPEGSGECLPRLRALNHLPEPPMLAGRSLFSGRCIYHSPHSEVPSFSCQARPGAFLSVD